MTIKKFIKEFEACENRQQFSKDFSLIIDEIRESMMGVSYESDNCKLCAGVTPERVKFAHFLDVKTLFIRKDVYEDLLFNHSEDDKSHILAFCFSKYFTMSLYDIDNVIPCHPEVIEQWVKKENANFDRNDFLMSEETGEVFSANISKLMIGCIPLFAPIF